MICNKMKTDAMSLKEDDSEMWKEFIVNISKSHFSEKNRN